MRGAGQQTVRPCGAFHGPDCGERAKPLTLQAFTGIMLQRPQRACAPDRATFLNVSVVSALPLKGFAK